MPRRKLPPRLAIREEDDGSRWWVIRDGQRYERTGCPESDPAGAASRLKEYLDRKAAESFVASGASDPARVTLGEVLMLYHAHKHGSTPRPAAFAAMVARLNEFWGAKLVSDVKGKACRDYRALRGSDSAARRDLECLRAAVSYYGKEHGLTVAPRFTLPPKSTARTRWLTRQEAARLLWACRSDWKRRHLARFILIGLYTGTRHTAILSLQWMPNTQGGWVDLERGVMHRRGERERETKKRRPPTRIPSRLLAHLRRWRRMDKGLRHVVHYLGEPVTRIDNGFRGVRETAGLDADVTAHTLRRTRATWLAQAGVPVWEAAGSLGMTADVFEAHYGMHCPDFQKRAADAY